MLNTMKLTTIDGMRLNTYYRAHLQHNINYQANNKTHWCRFTPYDLQETIYYLCKHLALPSFGAAILLIFLFFRFFTSSVSDSLIVFLFYVSILILFSVLR